jgi:hypothetical protein
LIGLLSSELSNNGIHTLIFVATIKVVYNIDLIYSFKGTEKDHENKITPRIIIQGGSYYVQLAHEPQEQLLKIIEYAARVGYASLMVSVQLNIILV